MDTGLRIWQNSVINAREVRQQVTRLENRRIQENEEAQSQHARGFGQKRTQYHTYRDSRLVLDAAQTLLLNLPSHIERQFE